QLCTASSVSGCIWFCFLARVQMYTVPVLVTLFLDPPAIPPPRRIGSQDFLGCLQGPGRASVEILDAVIDGQHITGDPSIAVIHCFRPHRRDPPHGHGARVSSHYTLACPAPST